MGRNSMEKQFLNTIHSGKYHKAKEMLNQMELPDKELFLVALAVETALINIYTFACFLLLEQESARMHHCAAAILGQGLCHIEGAYSAALFHARRAAELSPDDISCQKELLFFFGVPDQVMSAAEAKNIAQEILLKNPTDAKALETLEKVKARVA